MVYLAARKTRQTKTTMIPAGGDLLTASLAEIFRIGKGRPPMKYHVSRFVSLLTVVDENQR